MNEMKTIDVCLECILDDCDEDSLSCQYRQLTKNIINTKRRKYYKKNKKKIAKRVKDYFSRRPELKQKYNQRYYKKNRAKILKQKQLNYSIRKKKNEHSA